MTKKNDLLKKLLEVGGEKPTKEFYMKRFDAHFTLQAISYKTMQKLRERATYVEGKQNTERLNEEEFGMLILEAGVSEPSFSAPEIVEKYGTPIDAIQELLQPGEISKISAQIMELSGFYEDEDEVKN